MLSLSYGWFCVLFVVQTLAGPNPARYEMYKDVQERARNNLNASKKFEVQEYLLQTAQGKVDAL